MNKSKSFCDYSVYSDPYFDEDDNEFEGMEYIKIDNLYISPKKRGQGEARLLLTKTIKEIVEKYPNHEIKIVACPKEDDVDLDRLCDFYMSFPELDVIPEM